MKEDPSQLPPWITLSSQLRRCYAIGDLHGCRLELETLISFLMDRLCAEDHVVFLGDYLDRGPDSAGVVEALLSFKRQFSNITYLMGNHEEMFLSFLEGERTFNDPYLSRFGGQETFKSYQLSVHQILEDPVSHLPEQHLDFIRKGEVAAAYNQWLLVHAGVRPTVSLDKQTVQDLRWIRDDFIGKPHELGKSVVFGHTPMKEVLVELPFAIGIDTGVVYGNKLTCLELTSGTAYQVHSGESRIKKLQVF